MLIASESRDAELRSLGADGKWTLTLADQLDDIVELESIGCKLKLADLYERIEFGEGEPGMHPLYRPE